MEVIILIAGKKNNSSGTLYWKAENSENFSIGDYAIVENLNGYDLISIVGFVVTNKQNAIYFSNTKYENMKRKIKIIPKKEIKAIPKGE